MVYCISFLSFFSRPDLALSKFLLCFLAALSSDGLSGVRVNSSEVQPELNFYGHIATAFLYVKERMVFDKPNT